MPPSPLNNKHASLWALPHKHALLVPPSRPPYRRTAAPFFDEEDEALAAMEYARPRKMSKSMSLTQLAALENNGGGGAGAGAQAGRPPRESPARLPCCSWRLPLPLLAPALCCLWAGRVRQACVGGWVVAAPPTAAPLCPSSPPAVAPAGGSGNQQLGPLGKPIRRTNTFRWAAGRWPASRAGSRRHGGTSVR